MLMADLGAEVIKIEVPEKGDNTRAGSVFPGLPSTIFETNNRGVKSVTLNLKLAEARDILYKLVARADDARRGKVELTLSPLPALRLMSGMRYLLDYPYGCVEQTSSRVLPSGHFPGSPSGWFGLALQIQCIVIVTGTSSRPSKRHLPGLRSLTTACVGQV